jgi:hypothetical protein
MAKKKEMKQIFENLELESSEANPHIGEPAGDQGESSNAPVGDEEKIEERPMKTEMPEEPSGPEKAVDDAAQQGLVPITGELPSGLPEQESNEENPDDLLGDVRKSLLEEETQEEEKEHKWWRFGRSSRKKTVEEEPSNLEEINLPALAAMQVTEHVDQAQAGSDTEEYQDQIDDLIDMLDSKEEAVAQQAAVIPYGTEIQQEPEPETEPEKPVDIEELKKQAFQSRSREAEDENLTEVRSIALEGGEEVFVEVEAKSPDQLEERLNAVENALKPYQRYINFAFAFLGVVMAAVAIFLIYNVYQRSAAKAAPTELPSDVPYPTAVGLPGGWQFALGKGSLTADGSWNPAGAEWLQGTEVCRWVALPWSRQLEAVIRTLNPDDPIELGMSNNDKLTYNVYSVHQMSPAEMLKLDSNKPCLLIVLAEPDAEKRWVLTALP